MSPIASRPTVLDNAAPGTRHDAALAYLMADTPPAHPLAVATGYVNLAGLHHLATLADGRPTRLLIGAQPGPGLGADLGATLGLFERHRETLRAERDLARFPPSRAAERLQEVQAWLERPEVSVRRYLERFLHGKAYLLGAAEDARAALVTSANLTGGGLSGNLELGAVSYDPLLAGEAVRWFDRLWGRAADYADELADLLFPDPGLVDPRTVHLRALLELHTPDLDDCHRATRPRGVALASFQRDGYERARAIVKAHGGVVYADGVGTGKTEVGLAFIEERTREDGVHALVIAPAQLGRRWSDRIAEAKLPAQVISFNELASDEQLVSGPGARRRLPIQKDSYRLVLVDEAHALRNEDTTWYRAMERLMGGSRKELVLLSATPINNGLWDLFNLVMLFARHDRAFAGIGIDSVRNLFLAAGARERDPQNLNPDVLFPLADAVSVRRDRRFIEREYAGEQFPNGIPVRFPRPLLTTERYDLDEAHPGLFDAIVAEIDGLTMARYRPSAYELDAQESTAETQLGGLLKSSVLKRFESCWRVCRETVGAMIAAHDAFLAAWERGEVLAGETLRGAGAAELDESGLAGWVEERLAEGGARPAGAFVAEYADAVAADRARLVAIHDQLGRLDAATDPKLRALRGLLERSRDRKIAVFSTYGATVRYLDEHLPARVGGRARVVVIGGDSSPDERLAALRRFAPHTIVGPDHEPPDPVDLLLSTDVLSEGQNLQQAQAVISYDMPWNPQRVVQRNGRVIRLMSEHEEVHLTTMLPVAGELERLLGLEARVQAKIVAANGVYGMESEVIEGLTADLRAFAARLVDGDPELLTEAEDQSGALIGEELRRMIDRAMSEGELERVRRLPWGVGASFRQTAAGRSTGAPGVFFAARTPPMPDDQDGYRYWRFVETRVKGREGEDALVREDLEMLRRIDPQGGVETPATGIDLEAAWQVAAADIVRAHNQRTDLRAGEEPIGPRQRWALELLRDFTVAVPAGADAAEEALSAARGPAVRRALGEVRGRLDAGASRATRRRPRWWPWWPSLACSRSSRRRFPAGRGRRPRRRLLDGGAATGLKVGGSPAAGSRAFRFLAWHSHVAKLRQKGDMAIITGRAELETAEATVVKWMDAVRGEARRLDGAQVAQFAETTRRLATRLSRGLGPLLADAELAEIRGVILEGIERMDAEPGLAPIDVVDDLLVRGERIRHVIRDALDGDVGVDPRDAGALTGALTEWLPRIPQREIAALADISPRQLQRWLRTGGDAPARLQLVAHLVVVLRRAWTPEGVMAWFARPRRDLDGATPLAILDDPTREPDLLRAARAGRAQHGG